MTKKKISLFSLIAVGALGIVASASLVNKQAMAVDAKTVEILPWVKYEFKDSANPGKDTMNRHNLTVAGSGVSASSGVVSFDGNGALYSTPDLAEDIGNSAFTLVFDIEYTGGTTSHNMQPIGFGFTDWTGGFWDRFLIPQGWNALCYGNSSDGAGTTAWQLSTVRQEMPSSGSIRVIQSMQPGGNAVVYVPVVTASSSPIYAAYTKALPEEYTVYSTGTSFSIGDDAAWNSVAQREPFVGNISNVAIYDFAMDATQAEEYYTNGKVTHDVTSTVADAHVDLSSTVICNEGDSDAVILATAPKKSTIEVTMDDESKEQATATWQSVTTIESEKWLVGELSGVTNTNNVKAYGKVGFTSSALEIQPVAKYEFLDSANPGKDSMGNYDLAPTALSGGQPTLSLADGVITFDGSGGLVAVNNTDDISEDLAAMTLVYDVKIAANPSGWQEPAGFGWNDWSATWWNAFMIGENSSMLRLAAKGIDPKTDGPYWGYEIGNISTTEFARVIYKINPGEKASVWLNGSKVYDWACPADYNLKNTNARFALGGNGAWGEVSRNVFRGSLRNVAIYDFAMSDTQAAIYNLTGHVKTNIAAPYLSINSTPIFEGEITSAALDDSMTLDAMLSKVNPAKVKGTIESTDKYFDVKWEKVESRLDGYYVVGSYKVVGQSLPTTSSHGVVEQKLTVTINKAVVQKFVDDYMHMTDYTEDLGWCKDEEHHYYATAKAAYNDLTEVQKQIFLTDSDFEAPRTRLYHWAIANGELINSSTGAIETNPGLRVLNMSDSGTITLFVVITLLGATGIITGFAFSKLNKKRRHH